MLSAVRAGHWAGHWADRKANRVVVDVHNTDVGDREIVVVLIEVFAVIM